MSNYIYTNDGLINADELAHYGVPGMRLGERRARRIETALGRTRTLKKNNANTYKQMNSEAKSKYYVGSKQYKNRIAKNKAVYDRTETINNYNIAKLKAKKDKSYKTSKEYLTAKKAYGKQFTRDMIYGVSGNLRIESLKNRGYSDKKAKGKVAAEQILIGLGVGAASIGIALSRK